MLYAPTRTGKGVGVVIPNLLTWPDSVVVLDIKRENCDGHRRLPRRRTASGCCCSTPWIAEGRTARFNPLGHIDRTDAARRARRTAAHRRACCFPRRPHGRPLLGRGGAHRLHRRRRLCREPRRSGPSPSARSIRQLTEGDPRVRFPGLVEARRRQGRPLSSGCVSRAHGLLRRLARTPSPPSARPSPPAWASGSIPSSDAATAASATSTCAIFARPTCRSTLGPAGDMVRVAPLYSLLFQQLVDLSSREPPRARRTGRSWCCWTSSPGWARRRSWPTPSPGWPATAFGCCR